MEAIFNEKKAHDNSIPNILTVNAQDKEAFVNEVFRNFVASSFSYYYLDSSADNINFYRIHYREQIKKSILRIVPEEYLNDIFMKMEMDTNLLYWDYNLLKNARKALNEDDILQLFTTVRYSKNYRSKRKREKIAVKQIEYQRKVHNAKPIQERQIYHFSRPIFSKDDQYAIINFSVVCGSTCGGGCLYVFKKISGKWLFVEKFLCFVS